MLHQFSTSVRITLIYLAFSIIWLLLSDAIVFWLPESLHQPLQLVKGGLFILLTTLLIYWLLRREQLSNQSLQRRLEQTAETLKQTQQQQSSMLAALPISLVEADLSSVKKFIDQQNLSADELRQWFTQQPEMAEQLASKIKLTAIEGATLEIFAAQNEAQAKAEFREVLTPKALRNLLEVVVAFSEGRHIVSHETEYQRFDGTHLRAFATVALIEGQERDWSRVLLISDDISELRQAENIVDSFFDLGLNLHSIADMQGKIIRLNQGWQTTLGYVPESLVGTSFLDLVHPDDLERTKREMSHLSEGKTTFYFENRYKNAQGGYRQLAWSAISPVNSNIIYAVATDITERKISEQKLRTAPLIIHSTSYGPLITDTKGTVLQVNRAFSQITGYSREEVVGQNASFLSSGNQNAEFYSHMWGSLVRNGAWQGEIWNRRKDGQIYPEYLSINSLNDEEGQLQGYVGVFTDLSTVKQSQEQILKLSSRDSLTGLANRSLFTERLSHALEQCQRENEQLAVVLIDLDNFKAINDSLGFAAGDELLVLVSKRLKASLHGDDTVARISSDEFAVLLERCQASNIQRVVERCMKSISQPFDLQGNNILITASIGISVFPEDGQREAELIRNADTALSRAKEIGTSAYQFYTQALTEAAHHNLWLENNLRLALHLEQFYLVYQPQFSALDNRLIGMEVLLRWQHPERGLISPGEFIPIAERSGLIADIGLWVLERACHQAASWLEQGYRFGRVSVNVAGAQIIRGDLLQQVVDILQSSGLPAEHLELEVTESFIMTRPEQVTRTLNQIRELGVLVAIDDFGTGYSSLSYLKKLPIDKLKIDQSFVAEIQQPGDDLAIVQAIIALGQAM